LIKLLFEKYPSFFGFSVSHTTRSPRPGEVDGIDYHFTDIETMRAAIQQGKFIESAQVHTNYYGTSYEAVNHISDDGRICVLDIDIQGVQSVKKSSIPCKYIFIAPPTLTDLESRLRGRGTETEEKIQIRLKNAKKELEYGLEEGNFDAVIVNDRIESSFVRLLSVLEKFYQATGFQCRPEDVLRAEDEIKAATNEDAGEGEGGEEEEEEDDV
jgi:guanylate kinase